MPENHETNWPAEAVPQRPVFTPRAGGGHPQPKREPDVVPVLHLLREALILSIKDFPDMGGSPAMIHEAFRLLDRMGLAPDGGADSDLRGDLEKLREEVKAEAEGSLARRIEHKERIEGVEQEVRDVKGQIQTPDGASHIDGLSREITGLTQRVAHLELDKKEMENRMAAIEKLMRCPTSNGGFVESAVKQLDDRLKDAESFIRGLKAKEEA